MDSGGNRQSKHSHQTSVRILTHAAKRATSRADEVSLIYSNAEKNYSAYVYAFGHGCHRRTVTHPHVFVGHICIRLYNAELTMQKFRTSDFPLVAVCDSDLLYDEYGDHDNDICEDDEDDVNSLMDHGLKEVDDILREKGRLNVVSATQGPEDAEYKTLDSSGSVTGTDNAGPQQGMGIEDVPTPELHRLSARGTGTQAANSLKLATQSAGGRCTSAPRSSCTPAQPATTAAEHETIDLRNKPNAGDTLYYQSTNGTELCSFTGRRAKKVPFIQTKGLTLSYAQAKLFGLARTGDGPAEVTELLKRTKTGTTWSGSLANTNNSSGCSGERAHDKRQRNRTYSSSRMEDLARPVPGKARVGIAGGLNSGGARSFSGGRGEEGATFTWKRSRKAEAAMRDPACGYDFVREAGYQKDDFLGRVEAYSSYSRAKLEARRGYDLYALRLDKLECPR